MATELKQCPYTEPSYNIKMGSKGTGAQWTQWHLNKKGASLIVDGVFGAQSVAALKNFQKSVGLKVDGICGSATRAALKKDEVVVEKKPATTVIGDVCPYSEPTGNVKYGAIGNPVRWLQWHLVKRGADIKVDGEFGAKTRSALLTFQRSAGLTADGICGYKTRQALKGGNVSLDSAVAVEANEEYVQMLKDKREKMLDIIESRVGDIYVYGAQSKTATEDIIDWSARCFPQYTTPTRAKRMKQYIKDHPKNAAGEPIGMSDCSGLFFVAENEAELPLVDGKDIDDANAAGLFYVYCYPIKKSELQPLDLVFNNDLTHVGVVIRENRIAEQAGSDIGCVINDNVDDRVMPSIYGEKYGCANTYKKSAWTKFGRLKIYEGIPYEER